MRKNIVRLVTCMMIMLISMTLLENSSKAFAASVTKVEYKMKKASETFKDKDGKLRGVIYFQYPVLSGDSEAIKKINDVLKADSKAFLQSESAQNLKEYAQGAIENNAFYSDDEQYYYKTICKLTYQDNSVIGLHMKECWYAGGVYNQTDYGYTFDLASGEKLGLADVISGDAKTVKNKILAAGKKYLTSDGDFEKAAYGLIKSYQLSDFKFYLSKGKAYLCFGSYELGRGTGWDIFSIKSKY